MLLSWLERSHWVHLECRQDQAAVRRSCPPSLGDDLSTADDILAERIGLQEQVTRRGAHQSASGSAVVPPYRRRLQSRLVLISRLVYNARDVQ